jgi:NAD(P)-dependent dehydrogenase (short-subunit alcohol dehydrogenase family)
MGLGTVRRFLAEGARVVMADINRQVGEAALRDLGAEAADGWVLFQETDVTVEAQIADLVALAVERFGGLDVMFNNAGVGGAFGPITEVRLEDWDYTYRVLVHGVFLGIKHAARQMRAQGRGGSIINTGSIAGVVGGNGPLCYSSAKAAVNHLTRAAAVELAVDRIRVNAILPGPIRTPLLLGKRAEETERGLLDFIPLGRLGEPADIAGAAVFYASDDSSFVTGDSTIVDGGLVAASPGMVAARTLDQGARGPAGVNRGSTGQKSEIHR